MILNTHKQKSLDHAKHNKEACESLFENGLYYDWVITTAFYSALHFIDYKLFPYTIILKGKKVNIQTFDSFFHWYKEMRRLGYPDESIISKLPANLPPHKVRFFLVEMRYKDEEIVGWYKLLMDDAQNARYKNYKVNQGQAVLALNIHLKKIVKFCMS